MIIVSGVVRLTAGAVETLRTDMEAVISATRQEAGCIVYSFAEDVLEPGLVRIYEEWESREALATHGRSAHIAIWRQALGRVEVLESKLVTIEAGDIHPLG